MTLTDNQIIGLRMKFWRMYAGYSVQKMTKCVHKSFTTIVEWESGNRSPKVEEVFRWAFACGIPTDLLVGSHAWGETEMQELIAIHDKMKESKIACCSWGAEVFVERKKLGYTTNQFANMLGKTSEFVTAVEAGRSIPSLQAMVEVERELGRYDENKRNSRLCTNVGAAEQQLNYPNRREKDRI